MKNRDVGRKGARERNSLINVPPRARLANQITSRERFRESRAHKRELVINFSPGSPRRLLSRSRQQSGFAFSLPHRPADIVDPSQFLRARNSVCSRRRITSQGRSSLDETEHRAADIVRTRRKFIRRAISTITAPAVASRHYFSSLILPRLFPRPPGMGKRPPSSSLRIHPAFVVLFYIVRALSPARVFSFSPRFSSVMIKVNSIVPCGYDNGGVRCRSLSTARSFEFRLLFCILSEDAVAPVKLLVKNRSELF